MALTKTAGIMLVVGLVAGIVIGYGISFYQYSAQPQVAQMQNSIPSYVEIEGSVSVIHNVTLSNVEVEVGQQFNITLESNPTTGYQWQLAEPLDESILNLIGSEYQAPENGLIGAGGEEIWTFEAVDQGTTEISMEYVRPWETDVAPIKARTFVIIVE
ncbi:MAG: protease inhibitor I42 family protein [Candidatus Bathyarchaeota archaeon]